MNDHDKRKSGPVYKAFKNGTEFINKNKYWSSLAAILWAMMCLLLFTASQGIPFPISLIKSPDLILIVLFVAYFIPLCIFCLIVLPTILTTLGAAQKLIHILHWSNGVVPFWPLGVMPQINFSHLIIANADPFLVLFSV